MSTPATSLPEWASEVIAQYESDASNQFILYGNVEDLYVLPGPKAEIGTLRDYLLRAMMPQFDVILSYDLGNGIRVEKGEKTFSDWPALQTAPLPKQPRPAIETLTHYFRYCSNLARLNRQKIQVGCFIRAAQLVAPNAMGGVNYDLSALAMLLRDWANDPMLSEHTLATFLLAENLNDLHPLLVTNQRTCKIKVPLPTPQELTLGFNAMGPDYPTALQAYKGKYEEVAGQFVGATMHSIESLLKTREHAKLALTPDDLVRLKKELIEQDCNGLVEFVDSKLTLDDLYGQEKIKAWLRQDIALWNANDTAAMPMGYLLCGPVGTGKTFMVNCIAGEAGVPVVKMKNFRDKWVGSTEGNLEKIFRILHALGRCFVFIDEADQSLGKRTADSGDSGVGGRVYSMMAEEMSNTANRGKIVWVLASSRPDLIEVDLKRPGRVDVKIPLFPTLEPEETFSLLKALGKRKGVLLQDADVDALRPLLPTLLTPGTAEAIAIKAYRAMKTAPASTPLSPLDAMRGCLEDFQNPVAREVMEFQIQLAVKEASDLEFVPARFRGMKDEAPKC